MDAGVFGVLVVDHDVVHRDAVLANGHRFQAAAVEAQTLVLLLAEDHGLAILEDDGAVVTDSAVGDGGVSLVVEDHAVLQHLHHAGAVVLGGAGHDVGGELRQAVQRTGVEGALCAHHQFARVERVVDGAVRRGLGDLSELRGRAVLTLGQAVNLVVEDGDVEVLVTAHRMDEVVAADSHGVAVAHAHPDG